MKGYVRGPNPKKQKLLLKTKPTKNHLKRNKTLCLTVQQYMHRHVRIRTNNLVLPFNLPLFGLDLDFVLSDLPFGFEHKSKARTVLPRCHFTGCVLFQVINLNV